MAVAVAVFADERFEQVHDLELLSAGQMRSGLEHLLHPAFGHGLFGARLRRVKGKGQSRVLSLFVLKII